MAGQCANNVYQSMAGQCANNVDQSMAGQCANNVDQSIAGQCANNVDQSMPGQCANNVDQNIAGQADQQHKVLLSVTKNYQNKKFKAKPEGMLVDSDDEHKLVIDFDACAEGNDPSKQMAVYGKRRGLKNLPLRSKIRSSCHGTNEELYNMDILQEFVNVNPSTALGKKRRRKGSTRWSRVKKGELRRMRKPLKRLARRLKHKERIETDPSTKRQTKKKIEKENMSEYVCLICRAQYFDSYSFSIHVSEHKTDKPSNQCDSSCKQMGSPFSLVRHMYIHSGERPYECSTCNMRFTTSGDVYRHMELHQRNGRLTAESCLDHSKDHFTISGSSKQGFSEKDVSKKAANNIFSSVSEDFTIQCPVCGKRFSSDNVMESHMAIHSNNPIRCSTCNKISEDLSAYIHHSCSGEDLAAVSSRETGFQDLSYIPFSSANFPFVAKVTCEKQPRNSSSAFIPWECSKCGKAFPSIKALYQHELSHELGNMSCLICKCDFTSPESFHEHQLKHRLPEEASIHLGSEDPSYKEDFFSAIGLNGKSILDHTVKKSCQKVEEFDSMQYFVPGGCSMEPEYEEAHNNFTAQSTAPLTAKVSLPSAMTKDPPVSPTSKHSTNASITGNKGNCHCIKCDSRVLTARDATMIFAQVSLSFLKFGPPQDEPLDLTWRSFHTPNHVKDNEIQH